MHENIIHTRPFGINRLKHNNVCMNSGNIKQHQRMNFWKILEKCRGKQDLMKTIYLLPTRVSNRTCRRRINILLVGKLEVQILILELSLITSIEESHIQ